MPEELIERSMTVSTPARLSVSNISGSVVIRSTDENLIHIHASKQTSKGDAEQTRIEIDQAADGTVTVATRFMDGSWNWLFGAQPCDVDYVIQAPRQCSLKINGVNNTLSASGFEGDFNFKSVSGDMALDDLKGALEIDTVSGDVLGIRHAGSLKVNSVSGDVHLKQASLPSANIKTVSGDVNLQTALGDGPYKFHTVSGDVHLLAPPTTRCNVDLHSLSGEFSTSFPVSASTQAPGVRTAQLQGGGVLISLHSISGDIAMAVDGDIPVPAPVNAHEILNMLEKGELTVDEALARLNS